MFACVVTHVHGAHVYVRELVEAQGCCQEPSQVTLPLSLLRPHPGSNPELSNMAAGQLVLKTQWLPSKAGATGGYHICLTFLWVVGV